MLRPCLRAPAHPHTYAGRAATHTWHVEQSRASLATGAVTGDSMGRKAAPSERGSPGAAALPLLPTPSTPSPSPPPPLSQPLLLPPLPLPPPPPLPTTTSLPLPPLPPPPPLPPTPLPPPPAPAACSPAWAAAAADHAAAICGGSRPGATGARAGKSSNKPASARIRWPDSRKNATRSDRDASGTTALGDTQGARCH
jgi:hypothetical protein